MSASGIAEALGDVTRSAVLGKLHRLKLLKSRKPASAPRRFSRGEAGAERPAEITRPAVGAARAGKRPPEPSRSPWREADFAPLPGTSPRPWLSRAFGECAFPVDGAADGQLACCAAVRKRSAYCPAHHAIVFRPRVAAEPQRWAAAVERWAA